MKKKLTEKEALFQLKKICSHSEKSFNDILCKLREWGLENSSEEILSELQSENFINEKRYAIAFVHDKIRFNKWGKIKITNLMNLKKIKPDNIAEALNSFNDEDYKRMVHDELDKKYNSFHTKNNYHLKVKIFAFGTQRGYESSLINEYFKSKGIT